MIRATTGGVMLNYRRNLMNSFITQNNAMNTILTQRNFNSYAEDPASAAKAFKLRKSRMSVETQYTICDDTYHKYQTAFASLQSMDEILDTKTSEHMKTLSGTTLTMLNDPSGDAREQLSKVLDQMSEMLVQNLNQKYGENFIFAGADGQNVPFEIKDNQLYYRGVSVDAAVPDLVNSADGTPIEVDENGVPTAGGGYYLTSADTSTMKAEDYPEEFGMMQSTDPSISVQKYRNDLLLYNSDGTPSVFGDGKDGGYLARTVAAGDTGVLVAGDTIPDVDPDQLISTADYEDYVVAAGFGTGGFSGWITEDLVPPPNILRDENGDPVTVQNPADASGISTQADDEYYLVLNDEPSVISQEDYETAKTEAAKLEYLANEKYFVDIGLGFQENEKGQLIESSAFNAALVGINFFGYGLDADGDPKNIYSLVQELKDIAASVPDGGDWDQATYDKFFGLVGKLETASSEFKTQFTNMAAGTEKLENNLELLEDNFYNLQEQYATLEDIEPVEAINNLLWAQYSYNAALKVGNSILSQSLMDYLSV